MRKPGARIRAAVSLRADTKRYAVDITSATTAGHIMVNDMICKECGNEMMVDRINDGLPVYVCTNKQCLEYLKARINGEETNASISENTNNTVNSAE